LQHLAQLILAVVAVVDSAVLELKQAATAAQELLLLPIQILIQH
jgi:hypothetical protein